MLDAHFDHMWLSRYVTWYSWDSVRHHRALTHTATDATDNDLPNGTKPVSQTKIENEYLILKFSITHRYR